MTNVNIEMVEAATAPQRVEWEAVSLRHFVNRYIRTRSRAVNDRNRAAVQASIAQYRGRFPVESAELESFLDRAFRVDNTATPQALPRAGATTATAIDMMRATRLRQ